MFPAMRYLVCCTCGAPQKVNPPEEIEDLVDEGVAYYLCQDCYVKNWTEPGDDLDLPLQRKH